MELRCKAKILHGIVEDATDGTIEVTCRSRRCGKRPGVVVLHKFDLSSGELLSNKRFREPGKE